jgi:hypothetical protein
VRIVIDPRLVITKTYLFFISVLLQASSSIRKISEVDCVAKQHFMVARSVADIFKCSEPTDYTDRTTTACRRS